MLFSQLALIEEEQISLQNQNMEEVLSLEQLDASERERRLFHSTRTNKILCVSEKKFYFWDYEPKSAREKCISSAIIR